jgi:hypothetical protein
VSNSNSNFGYLAQFILLRLISLFTLQKLVTPHTPSFDISRSNYEVECKAWGRSRTAGMPMEDPRSCFFLERDRVTYQIMSTSPHCASTMWRFVRMGKITTPQKAAGPRARYVNSLTIASNATKRVFEHIIPSSQEEISVE